MSKTDPSWNKSESCFFVSFQSSSKKLMSKFENQCVFPKLYSRKYKSFQMFLKDSSGQKSVTYCVLYVLAVSKFVLTYWKTPGSFYTKKLNIPWNL